MSFRTWGSNPFLSFSPAIKIWSCRFGSWCHNIVTYWIILTLKKHLKKTLGHVQTEWGLVLWLYHLVICCLWTTYDGAESHQSLDQQLHCIWFHINFRHLLSLPLISFNGKPFEATMFEQWKWPQKAGGLKSEVTFVINYHNKCWPSGLNI